jgi:N utilization substance protein B
MMDMTKTPANPQTTVASPPKRSLTPRRRAREYALQGVYQSLVMRRAGSLPNAAAIAKQLAEDPGFRRCQLELFQGIFSGVLERTDELESLITPALDRPINELSPVEHAALLIGTYELAIDLAVPYKVAINEAVELAKTFGGTDAYLGRAVKEYLGDEEDETIADEENDGDNY